MVCSATAGTKTALDIIQLSALFQLFCGIFFKALSKVNVNYLKILKKHCGPHKRSSWARV